MNKNVIVLGKECNNNNNSIPEFIYYDLNNKKSIQYQIVRENSNDWKIYFYESGTLTFLQNKPEYLDVFLVGGGSSSDAGGGSEKIPGPGGSGGFTTRGIIKLNSNINEYSIVIGKGGVPSGSTGVNGEDSSAFGLIAKGGIAPNLKNNNYIGHGGSGGGGYTTTNDSDDSYKKWTGADGGSNGANGSGTNYIGQGQGFTTREFYESNGALYAGGGGGASSATDKRAGGKGGEGGGGHGSDCENKGITPGAPNTGGGGGGGNNGVASAGGSGIVVIRNLRNS